MARKKVTIIGAGATGGAMAQRLIERAAVTLLGGAAIGLADLVRTDQGQGVGHRAASWMRAAVRAGRGRRGPVRVAALWPAAAFSVQRRESSPGVLRFSRRLSARPP